MTNENTKAQMREFVLSSIKEKLDLLGIDASQINDDTSLTDSGIVDSMGFVELVGNVEDKFGYEIDLDEFDPEEFTTLGGFLKCALHSKTDT
jgi:acyl carrier protein